MARDGSWRNTATQRNIAAARFCEKRPFAHGGARLRVHAHTQYTEERRADFEQNAQLRPYVRVIFDKMLAPLHSQRLLPSEIIAELKADGLWVE